MKKGRGYITGPFGGGTPDKSEAPVIDARHTAYTNIVMIPVKIAIIRLFLTNF